MTNADYRIEFSIVVTSTLLLNPTNSSNHAMTIGKSASLIDIIDPQHALISILPSLSLYMFLLQHFIVLCFNGYHLYGF